MIQMGNHRPQVSSVRAGCRPCGHEFVRTTTGVCTFVVTYTGVGGPWGPAAWGIRGLGEVPVPDVVRRVVVQRVLLRVVLVRVRLIWILLPTARIRPDRVSGRGEVAEVGRMDDDRLVGESIRAGVRRRGQLLWVGHGGAPGRRLRSVRPAAPTVTTDRRTAIVGPRPDRAHNAATNSPSRRMPSVSSSDDAAYDSRMWSSAVW